MRALIAATRKHFFNGGGGALFLLVGVRVGVRALTCVCVRAQNNRVSREFLVCAHTRICTITITIDKQFPFPTPHSCFWQGDVIILEEAAYCDPASLHSIPITVACSIHPCASPHVSRASSARSWFHFCRCSSRFCSVSAPFWTRETTIPKWYRAPLESQYNVRQHSLCFPRADGTRR